METRRSMPARNSLLEAVELVVIGSSATVLSAFVVLVAAPVRGPWEQPWWQPRVFHREGVEYILDHPSRVMSVVFTTAALAFLLAWGFARLLFSGSGARHSSEGIWTNAFERGAKPVQVNVELRDGRWICGRLKAWDDRDGEPREIVLHPPIEVRAESGIALLSDRGLIVREADIRLLEFMQVIA
jgi:hypothetical protein